MARAAAPCGCRRCARGSAGGRCVKKIIEKKKIIVIQAYIVAESSHHKQIIIGKKGQMIKKVGEESRVDIQEFLNCKVFLDLRVKVDSQWLKIKDKAFNYSNI